MTTDPALTPCAEFTAHHQTVLNDAVDFGHRLMRLVVDQAEAGTIPALKAASVYDRVARSVRRSIWLIHKLAEPVPVTNRVAARKQIIRTVEDAIQRDAEEDEAETLHEELWDRLDSPDLEDEIRNRPVEDIIKDVVRDLGLAASPGTTPWKRRTPEDVTDLCARATQPPRPIATPRLPVGCNSS